MKEGAHGTEALTRGGVRRNGGVGACGVNVLAGGAGALGGGLAMAGCALGDVGCGERWRGSSSANRAAWNSPVTGLGRDRCL